MKTQKNKTTKEIANEIEKLNKAVKTLAVELGASHRAFKNLADASAELWMASIHFKVLSKIEDGEYEN